jgi:superfamily I DNA/RNA helicase
MDAIAEDPLSVLRMIHPPILAYLRRLVERHGALPTPKAVATTIHGAKGRECDLVVLLSDMTRATQRAYETGSPADREAENRVFYVGVTRAKERLVIVEPMTRRSYDFPSLPGVDELTAEEVRA